MTKMAEDLARLSFKHNCGRSGSCRNVDQTFSREPEQKPLFWKHKRLGVKENFCVPLFINREKPKTDKRNRHQLSVRLTLAVYVTDRFSGISYYVGEKGMELHLSLCKTYT